MATTYTGRVLLPTNLGVPSPLDIAVGLGRLPRWAGTTRIWPWCVLHHVVHCDALLKLLVSAPTRELQLAVLLHDADEVATGDIPTTWKTPEMRAAQAKLRTRVYRRYIGRALTAGEQSIVDRVDHLALVAEAHDAAPTMALQVSGVAGWTWMEEGNDRIEQARAILKRVAYDYRAPYDTQHEGGAGVKWFLGRLDQLAPGVS